MKLADLVEYFEPTLYEMSNFHAQKTGLPVGTALWVRAEPNELPHTKYRIKIFNPQKGSAVFGLWGDTCQQVEGDWTVTGKDLLKVQTMVKNSIEHIRKHIDGIEDSGDLSLALQQNAQTVRQI